MQTLLKAPGYLQASVKDADVKLGIVTGYFANFNSLDSDNDIIEPGAFVKTIAERGPQSSRPRIKFLLDHDTRKALGVITMLKEDTQGLYYEAKAGSHDLGVDFVKMVDSGIITEHSFGYGVVRKEIINPDADWREQQTRLKELVMWEGSPLQTWGANENTPLVGMKARVAAFDRVELIIKELRTGTYTEKTFGELEKQLLNLQEAIKNSDYETTQPELEKVATTAPNDEEKNLLKTLALMNANMQMRIQSLTN